MSNQPQQLDDLIFYLNDKGLSLLSGDYKNKNSRLLIKCSCGNNWNTTRASLLNSTLFMCPRCVANYKRQIFSLDKDFVFKYFEDHGYKILEQKYINSKTKMNVVDMIGYKFFISYNTFLVDVNKGLQPRIFHKTNPHTLKNIKMWIKINKRPFICLAKKYVSKDDYNMEFECLVCDEKFRSSWNAVRNGSGCPYCAGKIAGNKNNLKKNFPEISKEWNYSKNKKMPEEYVFGSHFKAWWKCDKCNWEWFSSIVSRTSLNTGCPKCCQSHGEKRISQFLDKNNIEYIVQYKFADCKNKTHLPFDFYIPLLNVALEYDGELHYKTHRFEKNKDRANEKLRKTQLNDEIKTSYCNNNGIKLIRIPFWKFDNIEGILKNEILLKKGG